MPYQDSANWSTYVEIIIISLGASALSFWRELKNELDEPSIEKTKHGRIIHMSRFRRWGIVFYRFTVRLSGSLVAGFVLSELVLFFSWEGLVRATAAIGGVLGWKLVDAWSAETLKRLKALKWPGQE